MATQNFTASLPENIRTLGLIKLSEFDKYFPLFSSNTLRQFEFHNKYGFKKVVTRIGGRVFIKLDEFQKWLEAQDNENIA